jgi:hypothetical protein
MDCLSQGGFSKISSLAQLVLMALATPEAYLHPDNIANALKAVRNIADDVQNCISCEAENVGFNYRDDEGSRRRYDASRAARAQRAKENCHV